MITEFDFEKLYAWAMGKHDGFTCPFCQQQIPAHEKHTIHLTAQDTYAFCEMCDLDLIGGNDGSLTRSR